VTDVVVLPAWLVGVSDDGGSIAAVHGGGADACSLQTLQAVA